MPFLTAGLPTPEESVDLFVAMADAGADAFEIGIPYSDPLMDGPTIHEAGLQALSAGATLDRCLSIAGEVHNRTGKPVVIMTYANPVLRVGPGEFAMRAAAAGASALIVVDVPVDESDPFESAAAAAGLGLVQFVAPTTTDDRLSQIAGHDPVFVYGIAALGVTGERDHYSEAAPLLAARVRAATAAPLVMGVGISNPEQAAAAAAIADGVIVGSALVRRVLDADNVAEAAAELRGAVAEFAAAVR